MAFHAGVREYGIKTAMKRMRALARRRVLPQKLDVAREARQLEMAGVPKSDISRCPARKIQYTKYAARRALLKAQKSPTAEQWHQ